MLKKLEIFKFILFILCYNSMRKILFRDYHILGQEKFSFNPLTTFFSFSYDKIKKNIPRSNHEKIIIPKPISC